MDIPDETRLENSKEHSDLERQRREQRQTRHITLGRELECRERLRRVSAKLAAVNDTGASALQTREWLEHELREMRDEEVRELVNGFAAYAERMRNQMEKMLHSLLEIPTKK